ncbi:MAG TPA: hypothetical protein VKZ63_11725 [Kofleriaceae bacterium]|nr:hypothetical protein [Kofleriaceae bacterium]
MNLRWLASGRIGRLALFSVGCFLGAACGGDDGGRVTVALEFPLASAEERTSTVHIWLLSGAEEMSPGCTALMARDLTPYDVQFRRLADVVIPYPAADGLAVEDVPDGSGLVYVEAVDVLGNAHLAGCAPVEVSGGAEVALSLRAPGTFDCADPLTENGDPCDDGDLCTVGEECRSGSCTGGTQRSCSQLADACNSARCEPGIGCVVEPLPDLTPCNDQQFCTTGEVCMSGQCVGAATDCSEGVPACFVGVCSEELGSCTQVPASGDPCDDGNECTVSDVCSSGVCAPGTPLSTGACDDGDACTVNTTCGGGGVPGECGGGGLLDEDGDGHASIACGGLDCNDNAPQEDPDNANEVGLCADGFDNDCDGLEDDADVEDCP